MKNNAFTLIELLVVVLIIGILAAIALPQYELAVEKSRAAEAFSILKTIQEAGIVCEMEKGEMCDFDDLVIELPGFECENVYCDGGGSFSYNCDTGGCANPYAYRENSDFSYEINMQGPNTSNVIVAELEPNKQYCIGYNTKGNKVCKILGGKQLATSGNTILYEL